jgi:hypothetical protein
MNEGSVLENIGKDFIGYLLAERHIVTHGHFRVK